MIPDIQLERPEWLIYGAIAVASLLALAAVAALRRRRALRAFAGGRLAALETSASPLRRAIELALLTTGLASLSFAMAGPRWGFHYEEAERLGVDILFAIDTSRSMLASDLAPDRLARAKLAVTDLVREFDGDRAGLVAFAGEAFLEVPMTTDRDVFERSLAALDTSVIPRGGTDLAAAIRESTAAFGESANEKLLVLLTDGENLEGDALAAAGEASEAGVRIFTVGVGTASGALLSAPDASGQLALVRDEAGEPVRSALDEATLRAIADETHGAYEPLGPSGDGLERLYTAHLAHLPKHAVAARRHRVYHERFMWFVALGLVLLLLEPLVGERRLRGFRRAAGAHARGTRRARAARRVRAALGARATGAAAAALAVLLFAQPTFAEDRSFFERLFGDGGRAREAEGAYSKGEFDRARALWSESDPRARPEHRYNAGVAAYRAGDWDAAIEALDETIRAGRPALQESAYYDRGNAQFRRGEASLEADREKTKADWRAAIESYESALALDAHDDDARYNRDLVARRLAALEEEPPPPNEPPPQEQGGDESAPQQDQDRGQGEAQEDDAEGGQGEAQQEQGEAQQDQDRGQGEAQQDEAQQGEAQQGEAHQDQDRGQAEAQDEAQSGQGEAPQDADDSAAEPSFTDSTGYGAPSGRLTPEQAEALLRSLADDARRFPLVRRHGDEAERAPTKTTRNW